jgi:hypothetical protein
METAGWSRKSQSAFLDANDVRAGESRAAPLPCNGRIMIAGAQVNVLKPAIVKPNASFGPLSQIDAGLLSVSYTDVGPTNGPAVILLKSAKLVEIGS